MQHKPQCTDDSEAFGGCVDDCPIRLERDRRDNEKLYELEKTRAIKRTLRNNPRVRRFA